MRTWYWTYHHGL